MASGGEWHAVSDLLSAPVPLLRSCLLPEAVLASDGALPSAGTVMMLLVLHRERNTLRELSAAA